MTIQALTLRQLRYFEALAQHRHFGRAAAACAVSQPALSMQIAELERLLGTPLFERGGRSLRLTAFGEHAAARGRAILRAVDELGEFARLARGRIGGPLRVGMIPTVAPYLLPQIIAIVAAAHSDVEIRLREAVTSRLIEELNEGRLDAAVVALPVSEPTLAETALLSEELVLVRPAEDAGRPVPTGAALRDMRLLLLEEGHCFRDQALAFCATSSASPRETLDASSLSTLVQMVRAGLGVTIIPAMAVPVEAGAVSIARFEEPRPRRTVGMVWRRTSPLAPALGELAALIGRELAGAAA
jgi:LysR family transcriptional regulator, hydrogen peroxide-inducible genes activator